MIIFIKIIMNIVKYLVFLLKLFVIFTNASVFIFDQM